MSLRNSLDADILVPSASSHSELAHIMQVLFESPTSSIRPLKTATYYWDDLDLGIKILMSVEMVRQDEDMTGRFVSVMDKVVVNWGCGNRPRLNV